MGKWQNDGMLDAALAYLLDVTTVHLCSTQPTTYTEATSTYSLGSKAIASSVFSAPTDASSGRSTTVSGSSIGEIDVATTGAVTHVAFVCTSRLLFVTTCTDKSVVVGDKLELTNVTINVKDAS